MRDYGVDSFGSDFNHWLALVKKVQNDFYLLGQNAV
jgi:hypothetical protein